jgi:hypothetical protein
MAADHTPAPPPIFFREAVYEAGFVEYRGHLQSRTLPASGKAPLGKRLTSRQALSYFLGVFQ